MSTQFVTVMTVLMYIFVTNTESQRRKVDLGRTPLNNASYYWPFDQIPRDKEAITQELKKRMKRTKLDTYNGVKLQAVKQLGHAFVLSGNKEWIDIKGFEDPCIWKMECPNGLSVGFWIKFISGDYILAAGGYAGTKTNGFRVQRDKNTKYHTLEVANRDYKWQIYIEPFPEKRWVYLSFSWQQETGLKLYFNGELTFTSNNPIPLRGIVQKRNNEEDTGNGMIIGRVDVLQDFTESGNFMIAHLAIWKGVLSEDRFREAYSANINMTGPDHVCCYLRKEIFIVDPCNAEKTLLHLDDDSCICPKYVSTSIRCDKVVKAPITSGCDDKLLHCRKLIHNQDYCDTDRYRNLCQRSCGKCGGIASSMSGPRQHFSEKTLIFALLGCVGGLVILFGVTVYFWKVYRTNCYPSETKGRDFLM